MAACPVFLFSCQPLQEVQEKLPEQAVPKTETVLSVKCLSDWAEAGTLDIFIYEGTGDKKLIEYTHLDSSPEHISVLTDTPGVKTAVLIANCPMRFKMEALEKLESMKLLTIRYQDDKPGCPLMSALTEFTPGRTAVLELRPLMCRVILREVTNGLDNDQLLEDPGIRLTGMNSYAQIFQTGDFRPKESIDAEYVTPLPNDIGFYTEEPGTVLYCYPNETPDDILGVARTAIEFSFTLDGERLFLRHDLPAMARGSTTEVGICYYSMDEHYFSTY